MAESLEAQPDTNRWLTGGRTKASDDIERRYLRGEQQVVDYIVWARESPWRPVKLGPDEYALEYPFETVLGGIPVRGYIDQIMEHTVTGGIVVRDLKTGTKLPTSVMQLVVYDLAIEDDWGYRPGWGDYYMAKNNGTTDLYQLSHFSREVIGDRFARMDKGVRAGVFLPNAGDACRTCGVSRFCSEVGSDNTYADKDAFIAHALVR